MARNRPIGQGWKSVLRPLMIRRETRPVPEDAWEREDVKAVIAGIWDIKMLLIQLLQHIGDDEEEADE
jgi:hypothetical protein